MRDELHRRAAHVAALQPGATLEDADLWRLLLLIDSELRQVPRLVMDPVRGLKLHVVEGFSLSDVEASRLLPAWQQARFRTAGYALIASPSPCGA